MNRTLYSLLFCSNYINKEENEKIISHFAIVEKKREQRERKKLMIISDIDDTIVPTFKDRRGHKVC